jgi:predicted cobalt transporter CbtA
VVLGVVLAVMPPIDDPIPSAVGAKLIWQFRVASLAGNLILWSLLTVGFGLLCAESVRARSAARGQNSMPFIAEIPSS